MSHAAQAAAGYMVAHDLQATHARRVRVMMLMASLLLLVLGLGWTVFFAVRGAWLVAACEASLMVLGATCWWLMQRQRVTLAVVLISLGLMAVFVGMAIFLDVPSAQVPRASHHFLIPLAVASYLLLKDEGTWLRHAIPLACLAALTWLSATGFAVPTAYAVPDEVRRNGTWVNNACAMGILYLLVHVFMGDITRMENYLLGANNRFVGLVRGMFPGVIAERLLAQGQTFAERHADCSVLFADIVGFTGMTERMAPEALVSMLSQIFSRFDRCVEQAGLTKIKTMGDAYMVASGVPEPDRAHAGALVRLALAMQEQLRDFPGLELRMGIASGELVAGVIGQTRQVFDVWGDVVNLASRMESHGVPGRIQVSESCYRLVKDEFAFEPRPGIAIKGKQGLHNVFLLRPAVAQGAAV